jgi:hypothetical protein
VVAAAAVSALPVVVVVLLAVAEADATVADAGLDAAQQGAPKRRVY